MRWRAILDGFEDVNQKREYLGKATFELSENYDCRIDMSYFMGLSEMAIEQLVGAVLGQEPKIDVHEDMLDFLDNVDGAGTTLLEFDETAAREALGMGIAYIGVDGPMTMPNEAPTRLQELGAGMNRAFLTLYQAEDVINWSTDERGHLEWVMIRQIVSEQGSPTEDRRHFEQLTLYDRESFRRWRREVDENGSAIGQSTDFVEVPIGNPIHRMGFVPVFPVYGIRRAPMVGDSIIRASSRADLAAFQDESWAAMARYRHANPILKLFSDEDINKIFSGNVVRLKKDSNVEEDMEYLELSKAALDVREEAMKRYRMMAVTLSGVNPQAVPDSAGSTTGESGIAQRVRFTQTQKNQIARFSSKFEATMIRVLGAAEMWIRGIDEPSGDNAFQIKSTFEVTEADDLVRRLEKVEFGLIPSETLVRELMKQAAAKLAGDLNPDIAQQIKDEIDNADIASMTNQMDVGA